LRQRLSAVIKRFLFGRIDHFVHYFRDVSGYQKYFGIGPDRSSFVWFKANISEHLDVQPDSDGQYVLCFGSTQRDYDTFFRAVWSLPYRAAIPRPNLASLRYHGSRFSVDPASLAGRVEFLDDDGSEASQVRLLRGARLVVLPVLRDRIRAAGISTYLNAMLLGKCVVISEGPGVSDVLSPEQAILVPPEDPAALAGAIERAWEDRELRERTARVGRLFAESLGDTQALYQRILDAALPIVMRADELQAGTRSV
jgi:glycosyltransferase involved in cell wall biosynthesis